MASYDQTIQLLDKNDYHSLYIVQNIELPYPILTSETSS